MRWWSNSGERPERRRRIANFDSLEARSLLSTLPTVPTGNPRPIDVAIAARQHKIALHQQKLAAAYAAAHPAPPPPPTYPSPVIHQSVDAQGKFVYDTYNRGLTMAQAAPVRKVGVSYAKLTIAGDTRKVGGAYLHAILHGNGKQINELSKTRLVKKVGSDFSKLSQSAAVKHVGNAFTRFGVAVGNQFDKYFGLKKSSSHSTKKA